MTEETTTRVFLDRVPTDWWRRVKIQAVRDGLTARALVIRAVTEYLTQREGESD